MIYANVMFRATSVGQAVSVWSGMSAINGFNLAQPIPGFGWGLAATLAISVFIVFAMPNTQQIMRRFDPAYNWKEWRDVARPPVSWTWTPSLAGLVFAGVTLFLGLMFIQRGQAVFLYFNF